MASYDVTNQGETVVALDETTPVPTLAVTLDGEPLDLDTAVTGATLDLWPMSYIGDKTTLTGVIAGDQITFGWGAEPETPGTMRSVLHLVAVADPIPPLFGPTYTVYDPADLWVNPADVENIAGGDYTDSEVIHAILFAQQLVRAWVSVPVQSPVPDAIRQATTLLAARALTTASEATGGTEASSGRIIAETIADYTVRYADPGFDEASGGWITPEIAGLLAPFRGTAYDVRVGPVNPYNPLPVTIPDVAVLGDFIYSPFIIDDEDTP